VPAVVITLREIRSTITIIAGVFILAPDVMPTFVALALELIEQIKPLIVFFDCHVDKSYRFAHRSRKKRAAIVATAVIAQHTRNARRRSIS
jgi:hypothetical protein